LIGQQSQGYGGDEHVEQ
jgi:hypothetical protein